MFAGVAIEPGNIAFYSSKPFGMPAFASAVARAFIQPSRKALSSDGGLDLP